jgi:hypothetical protein
VASLDRRGILKGCCTAAGLCLFERKAKAQQTSRFHCATIEPPIRRSGGGFQNFSSSARQATLSPFAAERLRNEFDFTPFGVASANDRWLPQDGLTPKGKVTLGVNFLNGSKKDREDCARAASDWLQGGAEAYLAFAWDMPAEQSQIRVRFGSGGNWSRIGRDARSSTNLTDPTLNISLFTDYIIRHEFGHALGLRHEHQHPVKDGKINWNERKVISDMENQIPPWSEQQTRDNILNRFGENTRCIGSPDPNWTSIMIYEVPPEWTRDGFSTRPAAEITKSDRLCVRGLYAL